MVQKIKKEYASIFSSIFDILRQLKTEYKKNMGKMQDIHFVAPNCLYRGVFDKESIIVDVGCGFDADFSVYMIKKYGLKSIGIDPTKKHEESLKKISRNTNGRFTHQSIAISSIDGNIYFNESKSNVSGSLLDNHRNIMNDPTERYEVKSVSMAQLPNFLHMRRIEYIKLDLEGAEFELIQNLKKENVSKYGQIFVEFHHHCTNYSRADADRCIQKMISFGFRQYAVDNRNVLFYKN
ncbi:MAG: hypothetical protein A3E02_00780 [Candidatus Zambryskibacteria bacterium RIFCSPHIGHO2_12_FULL_38_34]|uniref:Methyltransferase FkbM domain-containing protein n=1 Tax=Candidatus Zambryskibacteria bacterium RIFCSPLOWO2_12_FULL_39_16 TaxID=1802775 RepID=A0A1G2UQU4_9BACT|nr:MAG: hypothetical protein A3D37_01345 [Candidatus Zambryskibacteria bacterium RIFCSPHIGHO2_02_FULL_38_22]OHA97331.1 MAG: hypothetical protein A3E02_00780 [Candidatus Zambryskibacteria bacterium RIFCSPHIGHO2_12_FULL_38_34]OHB08225.1 MAG: hypothetical protein A3I19_01865 [Candidatus Zambryskibacteria bacterium RIFCSPLOWO2_02_FULL_38_13]OHB11767.1 MAG: hypothetical protein A3G46_01485 [Candidatus Zambryskibacteria bacterium RIFCSPLOWO2_12_FULL_39_16]